MIETAFYYAKIKYRLRKVDRISKRGEWYISIGEAKNLPDPICTALIYHGISRIEKALSLSEKYKKG